MLNDTNLTRDVGIAKFSIFCVAFITEQVPYIAADQNQIRTYVGSTAILKCNVARLDNAYLVDWSRETYGLPSKAFIQGPTLRLPKVQLQDGGVYVCSIRDPDSGRESSDSIRLEVERENKNMIILIETIIVILYESPFDQISIIPSFRKKIQV
jgi:hypothetical protein